MTIPQTGHKLHVYRKPKEAIGGTYPTVTISDWQLARYELFDYKHKIQAIGGDDTATCRLVVKISEAEKILSDYLGNRVAVIADDNPRESIWEGFISRVTIEVNGVKRSRSLDRMYNHVQVMAMDSTGDTAKSQMGAVYQNTESQAIYGVKSTVMDMGEIWSTGSTGPQTAMAQKIMNVDSWPAVSIDGNGSQELRVSLEMQGFFHTLEWDALSSPSWGTVVSVWEAMFNMVKWGRPGGGSNVNGSDTAGNGWGVFFNDRDSKNFGQTNTSFQVDRAKYNGDSIWEWAQRYVEVGDGVQNYIMRVTRTMHSGGLWSFTTAPTVTGGRLYRRLEYGPANTELEYVMDVKGTGRITTLAGSEVPGWRVLPDRGIRLNDILPMYNRPGADPRVGYIKTVNYDGNSGKAQWATEDNLTFEGRQRLGRAVKPLNDLYSGSTSWKYIT